jgi:aspartyl-tRNA(Asn)/glutamyl-tRNA(Gln) amidotransferase subunit C
MITEETVTHVAKLARLALTPEETHQYAKELSKILHMVDQLGELDLASDALDALAAEPTTYRDDEVTEKIPRDQLLANAPQEEDGFFRVPQILDEGN